jgi:hypothetical protein
MNRRAFVVGFATSVASAGLCASALAQATQEPTLARGEWIKVTRAYENQQGKFALYAALTQFGDIASARRYFDELTEYIVTSESRHYQTKLIEDAPEYGDESITGSWKVDADVSLVGVLFREGRLVSYFEAPGLSTLNIILDVMVNMRTLDDSNTEEELFALLPTETADGWDIVEETFDNG